MCRLEKLILGLWTSAIEKADSQIQPSYFGLVPFPIIVAGQPFEILRVISVNAQDF